MTFEQKLEELNHMKELKEATLFRMGLLDSVVLDKDVTVRDLILALLSYTDDLDCVINPGYDTELKFDTMFGTNCIYLSHDDFDETDDEDSDDEDESDDEDDESILWDDEKTED